MKKWLLSLKAMLLSFAIVMTPGCGQQGGDMPQFEGIRGPMFNVVDGQVLMTIKFLNFQIDGGFKAPIPKTQNSYVEFSPNAIDGGMMLQMFIDAEDLRSIDIGIGDANTLPDGRAIPGIPGGRLENSLRIDTPWRDISFFYHKTLFGLWMPFGFETAGASAYFNINIKGKRIGFIGLVGNDPVKNLPAGGVVLLHLEALRNQQLQQLIELSKRNPGVMY